LWGTGELWETQSQINFIKNTFGQTPFEILQNQSSYLENLGFNVRFISYPGVGHSYTSQMMQDVYEFLVSGSEVFYSTPTPLPEPSLSIKIDGLGNDWDDMKLIATDSIGDSSYEEWSDLNKIFQVEDENYVYFMVNTKDHINSEVSKQKVLEFNLDLRKEKSCGHSYDLHTNISSGNSISAWLDKPCGELETYGLYGYKVAWDEVLEFRILKSDLGEIEFIKPTFLNIWTDVNGEWESVDMMHIE